MKATRLEAFSDGVIAIIITIMVLELKPPHEASLDGLWQVAPVFFSYVFSFFFVAIYWVNHHHLVALTKCVDGPMLWYNLLLLLWLSLLTFVTAYLGDSHGAKLAVALYGLVSLAAGCSYYMLRCAIAKQHTEDPRLRELHTRLLQRNRIAIAIYAAAVATAIFSATAAMVLIVLPALMYFMPDRRTEELQLE